MLVASALVACGGEPASPPPEEEPAKVSFDMTTSLPAGTEAEHCKFVEAPAEGMLVNRDEIRFSEGSHHFLLYRTPYEAVPTTRDDGTPIEYLDPEQGVFDCSEGVQVNFTVQQLVGGSQNGDGDAMVDLPPGIAIRVPPKAVLLMNAHYINTSTQALQPEVHVDLLTLEESELEQEGGLLFWYNPFIKAPGQGQGSAQMICDLPGDVTLTNAQSHMHARGVGYEAVLSGPQGDQTIYVSDQWEDVPVEVYDGGMAISGGSRLAFTCRYDNPGMDAVLQGPRSTDEMCMFIGSYYPARPEVDLCSGDPSEPFTTNFMGGEWVGQGSASCAESLTCFQRALGQGQQALAATTECILASDPAVSPELSAAIGCTFTKFTLGENPLMACTDAFAACQQK